MNLLNILTSALTSKPALQALSAKTGISEKKIKMIIALVLPLLLKRLTSNASTQSGAGSLLGALDQHQDKKAIDVQLNEADEEDGSKIVGHILGEDREALVASVAKEADVDPRDVNIVLGNISPTILNGLSAVTQSAAEQQAQQAQQTNADGFDLSDALGVLGGLMGGGSGAQTSGNGGGGLLGGLMGGGSDAQASGNSGTGLLGSLLGEGLSGSQGGSASGFDLIGSLLGSAGGVKPEEDHSINGTQLISTLLSLMN